MDNNRKNSYYHDKQHHGTTVDTHGIYKEERLRFGENYIL